MMEANRPTTGDFTDTVPRSRQYSQLWKTATGRPARSSSRNYLICRAFIAFLFGGLFYVLGLYKLCVVDEIPGFGPRGRRAR